MESTDGQSGAFTCYLDTELARMPTGNNSGRPSRELQMEVFLFLTVPNDPLVMTGKARNSMQKYMGSTSWVRTLINHMCY